MTGKSELAVLMHADILLALGSGRGAHYALVAKRARSAPNGTYLGPRPGKTKGATKAQGVRGQPEHE